MNAVLYSICCHVIKTFNYDFIVFSFTVFEIQGCLYFHLYQQYLLIYVNSIISYYICLHVMRMSKKTKWGWISIEK